MSKLRPLGHITDDMEKLLEEMVDGHDLQLGEILALVNSWVTIHRANAIESYTDGTTPVFIYTHKDNVEIK